MLRYVLHASINITQFVKLRLECSNPRLVWEMRSYTIVHHVTWMVFFNLKSLLIYLLASTRIYTAALVLMRMKWQV